MSPRTASGLGWPGLASAQPVADSRVRRVVVDHVAVRVADLAVSRRFYRAALAPLGLAEVRARDGEVLFGVRGADDFALLGGPAGAHETGRSGPLHVAFLAVDRAAVDAFHVAALAAGGRDHLPPAWHPEYHSGYYGAFVYDPDGNNVEAVYHQR